MLAANLLHHQWIAWIELKGEAEKCWIAEWCKKSNENIWSYWEVMQSKYSADIPTMKRRNWKLCLQINTAKCCNIIKLKIAILRLLLLHHCCWAATLLVFKTSGKELLHVQLIKLIGEQAFLVCLSSPCKTS